MTSLFYRPKPIVGLDISKTGVRIVAIDNVKKMVHGYGSIDLNPSKVSLEAAENQDYLIEKISHMLKHNIIGKLNSNRVALGLPTMHTFARTFTIPKEKESNVTEAANLEAEQYIPMPLENLYVDHEIIGRTKDTLTVLMCAVPKQFTDHILGVVKSSGLDVAMIEPGISAIARLLEHTKEGGMPTVIVDMGPASTDIAIVDKAVRVTGGINVGGNTLTLDIAKKLDIPLETAHQFKVLSGLSPGPRQEKITTALRPSLMKIANETKRVVRFYTDRFPNEPKLEQLLIVGSGSNIPGLGEFFTNELVMPARLASPWQALNFGDLKQPAKQVRPRFMTAAGLALVNPEDVWR